MSRSRHAFTLVEVMVVVAIAGVLAALAVPSLVTANTIRKQQELEQKLEAGMNLARDAARTELRCVTVGIKVVSATEFDLVGTAHNCTSPPPPPPLPHAPPYVDGVPTGPDHEVFRTPVVGNALSIFEQTCASPANCPAVPSHGFGALYEFRPDGSLDHPYILELTHKDGSVRTWDIHSATGTVRKR
jgi:prepilin-type N-terminal cleavage/methylation domain-containing protein